MISSSPESSMPPGLLRHGRITCTGAVVILLTAGLFGPCDAADITIGLGTFTAVAVSPDGLAIAAAIDGGRGEVDDPTVVRWWNWNGTNGVWPVPSYGVGALAFAGDGSLLVGAMIENSRFPEVHWWRLGAGGAVRAECHGLPIGPDVARSFPIRRGIASIAELSGGQVVTGGIDATLAAWEGCSPTWLVDAKACCYAEHRVTVIARGRAFVTTGEAGWQGDELGYKDLGPQRWSGPSWRSMSVRAPFVTAGVMLAGGVACTARMDVSGHIDVTGSHPWTASIGEGTWFGLAASRDCKTLAAVSRDQRIVTITSP